jgi:DNA polymerase-1
MLYRPNLRNKVFLIIDGNSLIISAYHISTNPKINVRSFGGFFDAKYKVLSMFIRSLERAINAICPSHLCICFDDGSRTFRGQLLTSYKANRVAPVDALLEELIRIPAFLKQHGMSVLTNKILKKNFITHSNAVQWFDMEADDIIASLIERFSIDHQCNFVIYTADYDMSQLIDDSTSLLMKNRRLKSSPYLMVDSQEFTKIFNILSNQFVDYLAIKGDSTDNIPGIKGLGIKRTAELLRRYDSLENIFFQIDTLPREMQDLFFENKELLYRNKKLITLSKLPDEILFPIDSFLYNRKKILAVKEFLQK